MSQNCLFGMAKGRKTFQLVDCVHFLNACVKRKGNESKRFQQSASNFLSRGLEIYLRLWEDTKDFQAAIKRSLSAKTYTSDVV